jgi:hypothetical protein
MPEHSLTVDQAAAEIIALINARPSSPRLDEIEAIIAKVCPLGLTEDEAYMRNVMRTSNTPLLLKTEVLLAAGWQAEVAACAADGLPERPQRDQELDQAWEKLRALEDEIPLPPTCIGDIIAQALVAHYHCDKDQDDDHNALTCERNSDDSRTRATARLILSVLQFFGRLPRNDYLP